MTTDNVDSQEFKELEYEFLKTYYTETQAKMEKMNNTIFDMKATIKRLKWQLTDQD
jgi:hypothetical protein